MGARAAGRRVDFRPLELAPRAAAAPSCGAPRRPHRRRHRAQTPPPRGCRRGRPRSCEVFGSLAASCSGYHGPRWGPPESARFEEAPMPQGRRSRRGPVAGQQSASGLGTAVRREPWIARPRAGWLPSPGAATAPGSGRPTGSRRRRRPRPGRRIPVGASPPKTNRRRARRSATPLRARWGSGGPARIRAVRRRWRVHDDRGGEALPAPADQLRDPRKRPPTT